LEKTEAFGDSEKEKIITKELAAAAAFSFSQLKMIFLPRQLCAGTAPPPIRTRLPEKII
jgi:hypothetical protein